MKQFWTSDWFLRIIALILAILLFIYVNGSKVGSTSSQQSSNTGITSLTSTRTKTVSVPLQLNVNSNKYFVTGYPEQIKVTLRGPAALVTTTANTQNFKVYAALTGLGTGKHKVTLHQEGLNRDLQSTLSPATITVDIQPRQTVSFPVKATFNRNNVAKGYQAGKVTTDVSSVKATGPADEIARVKQVVAQVNVPQNTKRTINSQAVIEALDSSGNTVNVILTPATTTVNVPVTTNGLTKKVPVTLKAQNGDRTREYTLKSRTTSVTVTGSKQQLAAITNVVVDVDVSDVKTSTTKSITLDDKQNKVAGFDPTTIKVTVTAKNK